MCGRYSLTTPVAALRRLFGFEELPNLVPRYNVAPTQDVAVVRASDRGRGGRSFAMMRWGLVPSWARDISMGSRMINARAETVAEKPAFRDAYRRRRCLVLADGFYEWQRRNGGAKQPYRVTRRDDQAFAFAGLWERWQSRDEPGAAPVITCTILTTVAWRSLVAIHDRMPVILDPDRYDDWLTGDTAAAQGALEALLPENFLRADPVALWVNNVRNDDARCLEPLAQG